MPDLAPGLLRHGYGACFADEGESGPRSFGFLVAGPSTVIVGKWW